MGQVTRRFLLLVALPWPLLASANCASRSADSAPTESAAAHDATRDPQFAKIEALVEAKRVELGVPGLALAIVKDGEVVYQRGFGYADLETHRPVTPDTVFGIGSCTKAFTAFAVMQSVERGELSLQDPPGRCVPGFRVRQDPSHRPVTMLDLLSHRSGIPRTDLPFETGELRRDEAIALLGMVDPIAAPGEAFVYQNMTYAAAGECVANLGGTTWESLVERDILSPLGMDLSSTGPAKAATHVDRATGYRIVLDDEHHPAGAAAVPPLPLESVAPAGSISSTVTDMTQWLRMLLSGGEHGGQSLLSADGVRTLMTPAMEVGPGIDYGLGWFVHEWQGRRRVQHGGNVPGYTARVAMLPDDDLGYVLLTNASYSSIGPLVDEIVFSLALEPEAARAHLAALAGETDAPPAPGTAPEPKPNPALAGLAGTYRNGDADKNIALQVHENRVEWVLPSGVAIPLANDADRRYRGTGPLEGARVTFTGPGSQPAGFRLDIPGKRPAQYDRLRQVPVGEMTASALVQLATAAHGGARLQELRTLELTGRFDHPREGLAGPFVQVRESPDRFSERIDLHAFGRRLGTIRSGYDGERGFIEYPGFPAYEAHGPELRDLANDARLPPFVAPIREGESVSLDERFVLDGTDVYVLRRRPQAGGSITEYIDAGTHLLVKRETRVSVGGGAYPALRSERFSDYRVVDGIAIAHRVERWLHPWIEATVMTVEQVRIDADLNESVFRPADVDRRPPLSIQGQ